MPGLPPNNRLTQHWDNYEEGANSITAKCRRHGKGKCPFKMPI